MINYKKIGVYITISPCPDCIYNGVGYINGDNIVIGCAHLRCENETLVPTYEVNSECEYLFMLGLILAPIIHCTLMDTGHNI